MASINQKLNRYGNDVSYYGDRGDVGIKWCISMGVGSWCSCWWQYWNWCGVGDGINAKAMLETVIVEDCQEEKLAEFEYTSITSFHATSAKLFY